MDLAQLLDLESLVNRFLILDFTVCFGIACLFSENYHKEEKSFEVKPLLRDIYIYLGSLLYLVFICRDYKITFYESLVLVLLYPCYLAYSFHSREEVFNPKAYHPCDDQFKLEIEEEEEFGFTSREPIGFNKVTFDGIEEVQEKESLGMEIGRKIVYAVNFPWETFYSFTIFPYKFPVIAFSTIMAYTFLITQFTVNFVESLVLKLKISHAFIGLTLTSWGGNISDIINATVAAKHNRIELATSAIIGSQIINIHLCLGLPWLVKNIIEGDVTFKEQSLFFSIFIVFFITLLSLFTIVMNRYKLNKKLGIQLLCIYFIYFFYEFRENVNGN